MASCLRRHSNAHAYRDCNSNANGNTNANRNTHTDAHYTEAHSYPPAASYAIAPPDSAAAVKRRNPLPCSKTNAGNSAPRRKTSVEAAVPGARASEIAGDTPAATVTMA